MNVLKILLQIIIKENNLNVICPNIDILITIFCTSWGVFRPFSYFFCTITIAKILFYHNQHPQNNYQN